MTLARAVWFTSPRHLELREETPRPPQDHEVQVAALYSLVSAGTEMSIYRGEASSPAEVQLPMSEGEFPFPLKYGYQVVGRVAAAGPASGREVGDVVFANHPHQDHFTLPAALTFAIPPQLDAKAATFTNLLTVALNGLLDVPIRIGDCVAVSGLGIVGTFAAHLARRTAGKLVLIDPVSQRREFARSVRADAVVDPSDAHEVIDDLSQGRGADVFIEASGAAPALQGAINETGTEGTVVVLSYYANRKVTLSLAPEFHARRQKIVSSMVGMVGTGLQPRWNLQRRFDVALDALAGIDTHRMITHELPFRDAHEAYELIDQRPADTLGVLLDYSAD
jgi:2-desacetyl-2-hydroxyethyl bacteriochlorophyllide A dehydrogenase